MATWDEMDTSLAPGSGGNAPPAGWMAGPTIGPAPQSGGSSLSDLIFGSSPQATTSQNPLMTQQQQAALAQLLQTAMGGKPGGTPVGQNLQSMSLTALEQMIQNEATGGAGSVKATQAELDKIIKSGGSPVDINQAFTTSVEQPMLFDFQNKVLPMLQSTFAGSSAYGSDKLKQQELLTNNLMQNLTNARSSMAYQSQGDALNRLMQALGMQTQAAGASQGVLQGGLTAGNTQFQQLMQLLGQQAFQNTTTVTPGSQGFLGGLANAATTGLMSNPTMLAKLFGGSAGSGGGGGLLGGLFGGLFGGGGADVGGSFISDAIGLSLFA